MSPNTPGRLLKKRCYRQQDQDDFALLSGDYNPLHIDPVAARRTLLGGVAVHGVDLALSALEALLGRLGNRSRLSVSALEAQFPKPVLLGERVVFQVAEQSGDLFRVVGNVAGETAVRVAVRLVPEAALANHPAPAPVTEPLVVADFEALATAEGTLPTGLDHELAKRLFPLALANLGEAGLAGLLALTRLVGMRCPGLHSLFSQLEIRFCEDHPEPAIHYKVKQADERFRRLAIQVEGSYLDGRLLVFVRPPPEQQPGMAEVAACVPPGAFASSVASRT